MLFRSDQAQFRELEAFTQFGSDMDAVTAMTIDKGRKNTRLLVQPLHKPMSVEKQIAIFYCGTHGLLAKVPFDKVPEFEKEFLSLLELSYKKETLDVLKSGIINEEVTAILDKVAETIVAGLAG